MIQSALIAELLIHLKLIFILVIPETAGKDSFAQFWANRVGGLTYAFNGKTLYRNVPDNSLLKKISRGLGVDIFGGNIKFPEGSDGAERVLFMTNCSE